MLSFVTMILNNDDKCDKSQNIVASPIICVINLLTLILLLHNFNTHFIAISYNIYFMIEY